MNKILSICIPTYNRSEYLRECLETVSIAIKNFEEKIEIIISDNASSDDTEKVVKKFEENFPGVIYSKNTENIGAERNFRLVASMSNCEYIWILGDDDKITPDAIGVILKKISSGTDLIIFNYSIWDKSFSRCIKQRTLSHVDMEYKDKNLLMSEVGLNVGYISSVVIRKNIFFILPEDEYEKYVPYGFPFVYAVYAGLLNECSAAYIAAPLILNRAGNSGNYDWYKYFVIGSSLIFDSLIGRGYEKSAVDKAKKKVITQYVISDILVKKRDRKETDGLLMLMFPFYKKYALYWLVVVPILFFPGKIVWTAWWGLKNIREMRRKISSVLMKEKVL